MNTTANWVTEPLKKRRGRPKKTESVVKPPKRKRGRPKKVKDDSIVLQQPAIKRKRGRPKKQEISGLSLLQSLRKVADRGNNVIAKEKKGYYDISTNEYVEPKTKKKKTYTYIIEAKVRVVED